VYDEKPDHIIVFGADHVYRMDPAQMVEQHVDGGAGVTVAGIRVPRTEAKAFGCIDSDETGRITGFLEKPAEPPHVPDDPDVTFASMGNYVFRTDVLLDALREDAANPESMHDMGGDIIPMLVGRGQAQVYDFDDNVVPGATERDRGYWRDVGTLDAYYESHLDLVSVHPVFNLYNHRWPIRTATPPLPPAKFVNAGSAVESIIGPGSIVSGSSVRDSVIGADVLIEDGAVVEGSVLLPGVRIGKGAVVRRAILDKNVQVAEGAEIGVDAALDRQRWTVSAGGVVVLGKGERVE
jgi:glucose-1-phosphate adenylyltransferase